MAGQRQSSRYPPLEVRINTVSFATTLIELLFGPKVTLDNEVHTTLIRCATEGASTSLLNVQLSIHMYI